MILLTGTTLGFSTAREPNRAMWAIHAHDCETQPLDGWPSDTLCNAPLQRQNAKLHRATSVDKLMVGSRHGTGFSTVERPVWWSFVKVAPLKIGCQIQIKFVEAYVNNDHLVYIVCIALREEIRSWTATRDVLASISVIFVDRASLADRLQPP
ncbi:hypothetical protein LY78DRAFT_114906 [Colletotrichum sublineola]|nr:hypothetical protein LY78DRAFT_114906 [Colletotrichum sublineola]